MCIRDRNRIIQPLHSRCGVYEFNSSKKEMPGLANAFFKRVEVILQENNITYTKQDIIDIIIKHSPDWRRVLNEIQRRSSSGNFSNDSIIVNNNLSDLYKYLKEKNFKGMRSWVVNNIDIDAVAIFRGIYDNMQDKVQPHSIPQLILILADYQYKNAFVADHELNVVACLTEIMSNVEFI